MSLCTKCFCVSCQSKIFCSYPQKIPPLCCVNLIVPIITLLACLLSNTKFTKCLIIKANKMHRSVIQANLEFVAFSAFFPPAACPQGTFKSSQGAGLCQQCPPNSRSTIEAATLCGCRNGYYRGDMDKPEDLCTSESGFLSPSDTGY